MSFIGSRAKEQHAHCHLSVVAGAGLLFLGFCYKPPIMLCELAFV
ncbi:hypothetical protein NC651_024590 [Populus alba x Populus x berolinensis]|nr:hypothetical protein NC651_024590 [Populus alba x Populus x berolinensis]